MHIDAYAPAGNDDIDTLDALRSGLRTKIKFAIAAKKRRTKGEYRHTVGTKTYWHLDGFDNPELIWEGEVLARLLWNGARLDFPACLPQQSVHNRVYDHVLRHIGYGFKITWKDNSRKFYIVRNTKQYYGKWRMAEDGDKEYLVESNMILPYNYKY